MACGEKRQVLEGFWGWCRFHWNYPCGFEYCAFEFTYPCGVAICSTTFRYPCGVRWCRRWGVRYPCGVRYCRGTLSYPCLQYCTARIGYPCGFEYCEGTGYYPCRRYHEVEKYCYDYSSARESCLALVSSLTFCCNGQEYSVLSPCLGYVSANHGPGTECYHAPLDSKGACTNASMPPGSPSGPLDEGSVARHEGALTGGSSGLRELILAKLGRCGQCIRASAALAAASWTGVMLIPGTDLLPRAVAALAFLSSTLLVAHFAAFLLRRAVIAVDCGCAASRQLDPNLIITMR